MAKKDTQKQGRPSKHPVRITVFVSQETFEMAERLQGSFREPKPSFYRRALEAGIISLTNEVSEELESLKKSLSQWEDSREKD